MNERLIISRPKKDEYHPSMEEYIKLVPTEDLISYFENQSESIATITKDLSEDQLCYRYAEGKWTVKDICNHIIDCERIYNYRALCIARDDKTNLPGFEENDYAREALADHRNIESIIAEYNTLRASTIELFKSFDETMLNRRGIANNSERSVRSIGYTAAGHELHHIGIIKERYLKK